MPKILVICRIGDPITFEHNGKHYSGYFYQVHGSCAKVWHLTIKKFPNGRLRYSEYAKAHVFNGEMAANDR